jgi:hypothetical protein
MKRKRKTTAMVRMMREMTTMTTTAIRSERVVDIGLCEGSKLLETVLADCHCTQQPKVQSRISGSSAALPVFPQLFSHSKASPPILKQAKAEYAKLQYCYSAL